MDSSFTECFKLEAAGCDKSVAFICILRSVSKDMSDLCVGGLAQGGFTEETGKTSPLWMERSGLARREESLATA